VTDVVLAATIVVFFSAAAQLVRACGRITAGSVNDGQSEVEVLEREPGNGT
jgi:hypothetical protein